jgi:hypothetical protein
MMRACHVATPFGLLFILFVGPKWMASIAGINLVVCICTFFIFNGCFLSMLEERLSGDNFTIADPFLELFNVTVTNENRTLMTYGVAGSYTIFFFIVYYVRFYYAQKATCNPWLSNLFKSIFDRPSPYVNKNPSSR